MGEELGPWPRVIHLVEIALNHEVGNAHPGEDIADSKQAAFEIFRGIVGWRKELEGEFRVLETGHHMIASAFNRAIVGQVVNGDMCDDVNDREVFGTHWKKGREFVAEIKKTHLIKRTDNAQRTVGRNGYMREEVGCHSWYVAEDELAELLQTDLGP